MWSRIVLVEEWQEIGGRKVESHGIGRERKHFERIVCPVL